MKILLLDKDGTLVKPKSGGKFVSSPEDQELLPGAAERCREFAGAGWLIACCSNQAGIAAGHKSLDDAISEFQFLMGLLPQIDFCLFCPDFEGREIVCVKGEGQIFLPGLVRAYAAEFPQFGFRKPQPGMLWFARDLIEGEEGIFRDEIDKVLFVGDRDEDQGAAKNAGIDFDFAWASDWIAGKVPA